NLVNINKFLFLIFLFFAFNSQSFAKEDFSRDFQKNSEIKKNLKSKVTKNKTPRKDKKNLPKKVSKLLPVISEKDIDVDLNDDEDLDKFDYENLYKSSQNNIENIIINESGNSSQNNSNNNEFSDFGIIKDTVEEKKVIKKYDSEEDEIFLNKDIFDEKNKTKLRKSAIQQPTSEVKDFTISNRIVSDLSLTNNYGNSRNKFFDANGVVRYFSNIQLKKDFEFYGLFRFSRFDNDLDIAKREQSPSGGGSRIFENMGIGISELSFKYSKNNSSLILGKFTANFGTAWRWNKAIAVHNIPQNYALTEKLGITAITKYGDIKKSGLYNFSLSFFTNDRKNFDNSLFHRRQSASKSQALAGDTRSLASYALATDISFDFSEKEKLRYHIGYSKLAVNKRASSLPSDIIKKQQGIVFGMNYEFPINRDFSGEAILEHANIKNPDGDSRVLNNYLTTNFILKYSNKYSLMIGNSRNKNKNISLNSSRRNISEINIGYEFTKNKYFDRLTTQFGYYQRIEKNADRGHKNKALSILIRYYKNF
ncbi:MAG: hypothetical protein EBT63_06820, partial [Proteobacteria bacterium]|nr:hypothetical protein [Pseudomonadota bacterium]